MIVLVMKNLRIFLFILVLPLVIISCKNVLLPQYKGNVLIIDTKGNEYKSKAIISKDVRDFELKASIKFEKTYRNNSSAWAGFFIKADNLKGKHGKDSGYLCFVREDGEIGIHSSPPPNREVIKQTYKFPIKLNKKRDIIIICQNSKISFFVDNQLIYQINDIGLNGPFISANCGGGVSVFKIDYIKKM
ncbi:hypothetical protein [Tenacibaculum halocynthiae]|uniref:hypothetical protein n=1 Tax=Tenacibaculum halocynthiae TaxID=1254437 RepID=UPI0038960E9E